MSRTNCSNVPEAVYMQHLMGINGVIVDLVEEITVALSDFICPMFDESLCEGMPVAENKSVECRTPRFSERELVLLVQAYT